MFSPITMISLAAAITRHVIPEPASYPGESAEGPRGTRTRRANDEGIGVGQGMQ